MGWYLRVQVLALRQDVRERDRALMDKDSVISECIRKTESVEKMREIDLKKHTREVCPLVLRCSQAFADGISDSIKPSFFRVPFKETIPEITAYCGPQHKCAVNVTIVLGREHLCWSTLNYD